MKIETLSERIANAENKIGKKQLTIAKKQTLIAKKQQLIEAKGLANSDSPEALTLRWDIEHYTDDISRLEREINKTTLSLAEYRKQLTGLMERVSVWDIERRDRIQLDYRELDYKEFSRKYTHADVVFKGKSDEQIHDDNLQSAENLIIDLIYRVRKITGEITDWSDICASAGTGGFTVLNGTVIGKEGIAYVESITAGGYNIQRLHIRVLVHSV